MQHFCFFVHRFQRRVSLFFPALCTPILLVSKLHAWAIGYTTVHALYISIQNLHFNKEKCILWAICFQPHNVYIHYSPPPLLGYTCTSLAKSPYLIIYMHDCHIIIWESVNYSAIYSCELMRFLELKWTYMLYIIVIIIAGVGLVVHHIRRSETCGDNGWEQLKPIDQNLQYDFNFQQTVHLPEIINVKPVSQMFMPLHTDYPPSGPLHGHIIVLFGNPFA